MGETSASVEEVFEVFYRDFYKAYEAFQNGQACYKGDFQRAVNKHAQSEKDKAALRDKDKLYPFINLQQGAITSIQYRVMRFPWYVPSRQGIPSK